MVLLNSQKKNTISDHCVPQQIIVFHHRALYTTTGYHAPKQIVVHHNRVLYITTEHRAQEPITVHHNRAPCASTDHHSPQLSTMHPNRSPCTPAEHRAPQQSTVHPNRVPCTTIEHRCHQRTPISETSAQLATTVNFSAQWLKVSSSYKSQRTLQPICCWRLLIPLSYCIRTQDTNCDLHNGVHRDAFALSLPMPAANAGISPIFLVCWN